VLVDEFEQRLTRCHNRGFEEGDVDADPAPPPPAAKGPARAAAKKTSRGPVQTQRDELVTPRVTRRRQPPRRTCVAFSSDETSEEESEEGVALDSETPKMTSPIRRTTRGKDRRRPGEVTPGALGSP
ncbi:condensin complex subunit 1, partial [Cetorhinus maximus]